MIKCKQFYGGAGKGSASRYFTEHISSSDYYLSGAGILQGGALEHMGLSWPGVDQKDFEALENNKHPETGERITPKTNKTRVEWGINRATGKREIKRVLNRKSGMDVTLVVSKTLSMVMAENRDEFGQALEKICVQAKDKAMKFAESLAKVSVSNHVTFDERYTGNALYLSVIHREARAVGNNAADPYWHCHSYFFPVTYDPVQKRMRAITMSGILRFSETIDAYFTSEVVRGLSKLGVGTQRSADGKGFEVTSVKGKEVFSKRTFEILAQGKQEEALVETLARARVKEAAKLGKYLDFQKVKNQIINGRSRLFCKKKKPIERDEQLKSWRDQMTPEIRASLSREAVLSGEWRNWRTLDQAKEEVLFSAFKQDSVVHEYDIVADLLRATGGEMSFEEALAFAKGPAFIHLDAEGHVTTERVRQEERQMLARTKESQDTREPLIKYPVRAIRDTRVGDVRDQAAAVRFIWNSRDGVLDVSGIAGAGKSTMLKEVVPAIRAAGHQVILLAPTSASEKNLQKDFPEAITLQKFESDLEAVPGIGENLVIFLDESSMVSVPQMAKLVELVHSHGCRLVTLGDVDQHRSYARGDAIRILQESGSVRSVQLTETYRAQVAYLKETVMDLKAGGMRREIGFKRLDQHGDIRELEDVDKMRAKAVQTHLDAVRKGELAIMASPTHAEAREVAEMVRKTLKAEGKIEAIDHVVTRLSTVDIEGPELRDPVHYQPGRVLGFHHKVRGGFRSGEKWRIIGPAEGGGFGVECKGQTKIFDPSVKGHWKIYDATEMVLSVGDQVRINEGFKEGWVPKKGGCASKKPCVAFKNNDIANIAAIDDERIMLDDGRSMSRDNVHLDQGVCITSYAAECRTVKQIVSLVPCASLPALDAKTFYVLASRATHRLSFIPTAKKRLKKPRCGKVTGPPFGITRKTRYKRPLVLIYTRANGYPD